MGAGIGKLVGWAMRIAVHAGLVVGSVGLTLVGFEVVAREIIPDWAPPAGDRQFWTFDRELGWHHRPGQSGDHTHRDFQVSVRINERGLRDQSYALDRTRGVPRMLMLGDSFGWGHGVEAHEMASEILEARRPPWEIINASVSGYGTDQQLLWFMEEGRRYAADVVLLLFHPNDFLDNHRWSRYGYRKPVFALEAADASEDGLTLTRVPVQRRSWDDRLDRWLYLHSYLYPRLLELPDIVSEARLALRQSQAAARATASLATVPAPAKASPAPVASPAPARRSRTLEDEHLEITRRVLLKLAREVEGAGGRLVVASVPMAPHLRGVMANVLDEAEVAHLALEEALDPALHGQLYFRHDPHWNATGQRVVADAIERFLVEQEIFADPSSAGSDPRAGATSGRPRLRSGSPRRSSP